MDSNGKFWSVFLCISGAVIITLVVSSTIYWVDHNSKIVNLIENGVSPIAAMCAMQNDHGNHAICLVLAVKSEAKIVKPQPLAGRYTI